MYVFSFLVCVCVCVLFVLVLTSVLGVSPVVVGKQVNKCKGRFHSLLVFCFRLSKHIDNYVFVIKFDTVQTGIYLSVILYVHIDTNTELQRQPSHYKY